jgi:hypothetical protein
MSHVLRFPSPSARQPDVWETDASDGYIGLIVQQAGADRRASGNRGLLMRVEIRTDVYSTDIVRLLERWAAQAVTL